MGFAARLALFYAAVFVSLGIQLPFLPVWMSARGLDDRAIGLVLAVGGMARIAAAPLAGIATDRFGVLKGAIVLAAVASATSAGLLGASSTPVAIAAAFAAVAASTSVALPLADVYALKGLPPRGFAYGPVRLWGSVAFIVGSLVAGFAAGAIGRENLVWAIAAVSCLAVLAAAALEPLALSARGEHPRGSALEALRTAPSLVLAITASSLTQGSHALYYGFGSLDWLAQGLDGATVGALWALSVAAEVVLFAFSARLPLGPSMLLILGALGAVLRWSAMAFGPPAWLLPALQCLHALSFGATHLGAVQIVARAAPAGLSTTTQGLLAMANSAVGALAAAASGLLYARFGAASYAAMALLALAGAGFALALHRPRP